MRMNMRATRGRVGIGILGTVFGIWGSAFWALIIFWARFFFVLFFFWRTTDQIGPLIKIVTIMAKNPPHAQAKRPQGPPAAGCLYGGGAGWCGVVLGRARWCLVTMVRVVGKGKYEQTPLRSVLATDADHKDGYGASRQGHGTQRPRRTFGLS